MKERMLKVTMNIQKAGCKSFTSVMLWWKRSVDHEAAANHMYTFAELLSDDTLTLDKFTSVQATALF